MFGYVNIEEFIGKTVSKIICPTTEDDGIVFEFDDGSAYRMYHSQDCCEYVRLEEVIGGSLDDLVGGTITAARASVGYGPSECSTWTFYHLI